MTDAGRSRTNVRTCESIPYPDASRRGCMVRGLDRWNNFQGSKAGKERGESLSPSSAREFRLCQQRICSWTRALSGVDRHRQRRCHLWNGSSSVVLSMIAAHCSGSKGWFAASFPGGCPVVNGAVDEEIPAEGLAAEQEAVDHALAADEADDDALFHLA